MWVAEQMGRGIDGIICHPRLVQTGLGLIEFPTICWYDALRHAHRILDSVERNPEERSWVNGLPDGEPEREQQHAVEAGFGPARPTVRLYLNSPEGMRPQPRHQRSSKLDVRGQYIQRRLRGG